MRSACLLAGLVLPWLVACSDGTPSDSSARLASSSSLGAVDPADVQTLIRAGVRDSVAVPTAVVFPQDLALHPDSGAESLRLRALTAAGDNLLAVRIELDRLSLNRAGASGSAWDYHDVVSAHVVVEQAGEAATLEQTSRQRVALGLAESTVNRLRSGTALLQIDSTPLVSSQNQGSIIVPDGSPPTEKNEPQVAQDADCRADWLARVDLPSSTVSSLLAAHWDSSAGGVATERGSTISLSVRLSIHQCPDSLIVGGLARWQLQAIPATLELTAGNSVLFHQPGHAWLDNNWGLPDEDVSARPVLIDTADLVLQREDETALSLSVNRSKRRSGTGPETVQASLSNAPANEMRPLSMTWQDSPATDNNESLPASIALASQDGRLALEIIPLTPPIPALDLMGSHWRGAVKVQGSHAGYGYVDYRLRGGGER